MTNLLTFVAPLALLLPAVESGPSEHARAPLNGETCNLDPRQVEKMSSGGQSLAPQAFDAPVQRQVRIERRVIVRITPRSSRARTDLMANLPPRAPSSQMVERKIGKCIKLKNIAAVQTGSGNKLILYMRDSKVLSATLEKSCRSRDFYSGFYVEKDKDGKLCVDRDELLSRSGAKCEVDRLRQLVSASK